MACNAFSVSVFMYSHSCLCRKTEQKSETVKTR